MDGILHVIEQLGQAHKQALTIIEQQAAYIKELEADAQSRSDT